MAWLVEFKINNQGFGQLIPDLRVDLIGCGTAAATSITFHEERPPSARHHHCIIITIINCGVDDLGILFLHKVIRSQRCGRRAADVQGLLGRWRSFHGSDSPSSALADGRPGVDDGVHVSSFSVLAERRLSVLAPEAGKGEAQNR